MTTNSLFAALALSVLGQPAGNPDDAVTLALKDVKSVPAEARNLTRYVSAYNHPADEREDVGRAVAFVVNSLSRTRRIVVPVWVDKEKTLLRINLGAYEIDPKVYEKLESEPYFSTRKNGKRPDLAALMKETLSNAPIVRADYFIHRALTSPFYYQLLGVKDRKTFMEALHADEDQAVKAKGRIAGILLNSSVTANNRFFYRTPTVCGHVYEARDALTSTGKKDFLKNLFSHDYDSGTAVGTLPNGLLAYGAWDSEGVLADSMDPKIAIDVQTSGFDKVVRNPKSCMGCHHQGVVAFDCEVRRLCKDDDFKLNFRDLKLANKVADHFSVTFPFDRDQKDYADALKVVNGLDGKKNSEVVTGLYESYEGRVKSQAVMARELGCTVTQLKKAISLYANASLMGVLKDRPVARDQFAEAFQDLYHVIHEK